MKKREHDYNIENELKQLTCPDDEIIEKIAEEIPMLDDAAKERILKLCERKMDMKMNKDIKNNIKRTDYDNSDTVNGVEKYNRPKWYRPVMSTAASLLVVAGVGGAIALKGNLKPEDTMSETGDSNVSNETEASLRSLVEDNFYCLENVLFFGSLPHKDVTLADGTCFEVDSEKFPDYAAFEKYMYSVYSDDIADFYLTSYPSGAGAYVDIDGTLGMYPGIIADGQNIDVDFTDFDIANISENDGTYSFDVLADINIYDEANKDNDSYKTVLEDALIGFEAKTEDDGIRLTGMYGHDTATRFIYNKPVKGSRGYIDTKWQKSYFELMDHLSSIYNPEDADNSIYYRLYYPEGLDIPLLGVNDSVTDNIVLLYQIIDGHTYLVDDSTPYEGAHVEVYDYAGLMEYLEKAVFEEGSESTTVDVSEEIKTSLNGLVEENFYCLENVFYFGNLPYDYDSPTEHFDYNVESDIFPDFYSLRSYMHSIYTYDIAEFYMTQYPYGEGTYLDHDGGLHISSVAVPYAETFNVDFKDFEIANASQEGSIISFDVIVDIDIKAVNEEASIYNSFLEDAVIGFEAKDGADGIRLTGMYGHDTLERFQYNNPVEGYRGYVDAKWEETYLELLNGILSEENENTEDYTFELFNLTDGEVPMMYVYPAEPDGYGYIYSIVDGDVYIVKDAAEDMGYFGLEIKDGIYVGYNMTDDAFFADFYEINGLDLVMIEDFLYRENTYMINGSEVTEKNVKQLFLKYGISTDSKTYTADEIIEYLENAVYGEQ